MSTFTPATISGEKPLQFEFATAHRVIFGSGVSRELGRLASTLGKAALVVTGSSPSRKQEVLETLSRAGVTFEIASFAAEPTLPEVLAARDRARAMSADMVIGIGGGSAMDAAKAVAGLAPNPGDIYDYLEVVGRGNALPQPGLPCLVVPTTAGTGSEVTKNAVITIPDYRVKASLRSTHLLPRIALVDPLLTLDMPAHLTASTGLDALTQLLEPYVSNRANPITDSFCLDGLRRAARSLERAWLEPQNVAAREDMSLASLLSGMALANSGLGVVHAFAAAIGGAYPAPHGAICASLLAPCMEMNLQALRLRTPSSSGLQRFRYIARLLTAKEDATADAGIAWVRALVQKLELKRLRDFKIQPSDFPGVVEKAMQTSSMRGNPVPLTTEELMHVLERAW